MTYTYIAYLLPILEAMQNLGIFATPADQMSDKSGFDIWRECHLKPDGMIFVIFRLVWKINL